MSFARTLIKLSSFQIHSGADTIPYGTENIPYDSEATAGSTVKAALDTIFAVLYPNTQASVETTLDLPLVGNTLRDYRMVLDDGDGKAAGYRWEQREGDVSPQWYKVHDMDWSNDAILSSFIDQTLDLYVSKYGRQDLDASGNPVTGKYEGQSVYGGATSGNLTLRANAGDTSSSPGDQTGYVQFGDHTRPTDDAVFDLGTAIERFRDLYLSRNLTDGTNSVSVAQTKGAYDHSQITNANPHATSYDQLSAKLGTLTLDGDASGSADLSTSGNKTLTVTVADDSHTHDALTTINNFDTAVYNELKLQLVDNGPLTWVFDDGLEEVTPVFNADTGDISDIASPAANKILASNPLGDSWTASDGTIELVGDVTGSGTFNSTLDKWQLTTTVASSNISGLGGVTLTNKTFTSVAGTPTTVTVPSHGLRTGETIRISGSTTLDGEKVITVVDSNTFTIPDTTAGAESGSYIPQGGQLLYNTSTGNFQVAKEYEEIRLGELSGRDEDVLDIYVAKNGRSGGQEVTGGISAGESLVLESTSNATKGSIEAKSNVTPFADAVYSGGWSGTDLGSTSKRWNDIYMSGEAKGMRVESVGSLPAASGTQVGRMVYFEGNAYICNGAEYVAVGTGSGSFGVSTKTASYTMTEDDDVILADATSGTLTVTLPVASTITKKLIVKKIDSTANAVNIDGNGAETIDGSLNYDIFDQYHSVTLVSNGTGWFII